MSAALDIEATVNQAWQDRDGLSTAYQGPAREAVNAALQQLDSGAVRVAEKIDGEWKVHQWLKKAVLLSFRLNANMQIAGGPGAGVTVLVPVLVTAAGGTKSRQNLPAGAKVILSAPGSGLCRQRRSGEAPLLRQTPC